MSPETLKMVREALIYADRWQRGVASGYEWEERFTAALRALDAATPAGPSGWMPIESAPKDGTEVLTLDSWGHVRIGHWSEGAVSGWGWMFKDKTHWMPLPPAPTDKEPKP